MYYLNVLFNILYFLVIIPGLWISGMLIPEILGWIKLEWVRKLISKNPMKLVVWLAFGYFISSPMRDLLVWLQNWVELVVQSPGKLTTVWGNVPLFFNSLVYIVLFIAIYGAVIFLSQNLWGNDTKTINLYRFAPILAVASAVFNLVRGTTLQIVLVQNPGININDYGIIGFSLGWIVGLTILTGIILILHKRLQDHWDDHLSS